jgi:hypothetical protein
VISVGIDPGESAAVAAVQSQRGKRPRLLGLWPIYASTPGPWLYRADAAMVACADLLERMAAEAEASDRPLSALRIPRVSIEGVVKAARGPFAHHASGWGLGFRAGQLHALAWMHLGTPPVVVLPTAKAGGWWGKLAISGKAIGKKLGDGQHRVREAGLFVEGAGEALAGLDTSCAAARARVVDSAEAILIAAAGLHA